MINLISNYSDWLHGHWPSSEIEKQPLINANGTTNVKGVYVVGDLTGVPLLKFAADTGVKAVQSIVNEANFSSRTIR